MGLVGLARRLVFPNPVALNLAVQNLDPDLVLGLQKSRRRSRH